MKKLSILELINFFLEPLSSEHPPKWFIFLTPTLVTVSIPIAYYFFVKRKDLLPVIVDNNRPFYNFLKINGTLMKFMNSYS